MINKHCIKAGIPPEDAITDRMINEFLRQCPYCQITNRLRLPIKAHRFTCASYNFGRFGSPEVIHTDQGPAFHNELVQELLRLCGIDQSFATAYVERYKIAQRVYK